MDSVNINFPQFSVPNMLSKFSYPPASFFLLACTSFFFFSFSLVLEYIFPHLFQYRSADTYPRNRIELSLLGSPIEIFPFCIETMIHSSPQRNSVSNHTGQRNRDQPQNIFDYIEINKNNSQGIKNDRQCWSLKARRYDIYSCTRNLNFFSQHQRQFDQYQNQANIILTTLILYFSFFPFSSFFYFFQLPQIQSSQGLDIFIIFFVAFTHTPMDDQDYYADYYQEEDYYNYDSYMGEAASSNTYDTLPLSSIFNQVKQMTQQTMQTVALPFGWTILLLREFKWQPDYLGDYFQNMEKYKKIIGYSKGLLSVEECMKKKVKGECMVCMNYDYLITNICKDQFCQNCWAGHIEEHLNNLNPFMKCMNCQVPLLYESVKQILDQPQFNKIYNRYEKLICQFFTSTNKNYQCCPGVDCNYCIKCQNYSVTTVKCICGKSFCFKCKGDDHSPCLCEEKNKWVDIVLKQQANAKWIAQNTKICPSCNKAVQRSQGCNFMACTCGKNFCYMCSKPWEPDHKDHFKCHIYKKKNEDESNREKAVLQKINFYAEKYLNLNGVVQALKKFQTFEKRKLLYESLGIDLSESDFIDQAYKFAIECCESLKWIYVYTFFVQILDESRRNRFLYSQGQYESFKQELQKKLSYDLKNFFTKVELRNEPKEKYPKNKIPVIDSKEKLIQQFWAIKTHIINCYRFTKQFKEKFIQEIQSLDMNQVKRNPDGQDKEKKSGIQNEEKTDNKKAAKKK